MKAFDQLQAGDEVLVWHHGAASCRARITSRKGDGVVTAVMWNSISQRWNNNPLQLQSHRIAEYPTRRSSAAD
jgi:hypothetical protein